MIVLPPLRNRPFLETFSPTDTMYTRDAALCLCQCLQRSHILSECMWVLPLSPNVFAVGSELEECIVVLIRVLLS